MAAQPLPRVTPEEYLKAERAAEFKSEYYHGHVYRLAGGTYPHGIIMLNLGTGLHTALRGGPCRITASDVRLRISEDGLYTYPLLMAVCGQPEFADNQRDTVLNPTLLTEVLSSSTESHDRGFKFAQYRQLDSLREYAMVSQSEPRVEKYVRQSSGEWAFSEVYGIDAFIMFESVACMVALSGICDGVQFEVAPDIILPASQPTTP